MPNFLTDPYWIVAVLGVLAGIGTAVVPLIQLLQSNYPRKKDLTYTDGGQRLRVGSSRGTLKL